MKETDTKNPISADASREQSSDNAMAYDSGLGAVRAPADWSRPMLDFVFLPAHAQASAPGQGSLSLSPNSRTSSVEVVVPGEGETGEVLSLYLSKYMNPTEADDDAAMINGEELGIRFIAQAQQGVSSSGFGTGTALAIYELVAGDRRQIRIAFADSIPPELRGTSAELWVSFGYNVGGTGVRRPVEGAQPVRVVVNYPDLETQGRVMLDGPVSSSDITQTVRYTVPPDTFGGRLTYSLPPGSPLVFFNPDGSIARPPNMLIQEYSPPGPGADPVVQTLRVRLRDGLTEAGTGEVELTVTHDTSGEISTEADVIPVSITVEASGGDVLTISSPAGIDSPASGELILGGRRPPGGYIALRIVDANGVVGFVDTILDTRSLAQFVPADRQEFRDARPKGGFPAGNRIPFSIEFLLDEGSNQEDLAGLQSEYTVQAFFGAGDGEEIEIARASVRIAGNTESLLERERVYLEQLRREGSLPSDAIIIRLPPGEGMAGAAGTPGATGRPGSGGAPDGPPGATGATGPFGARGRTGPRGNTGATGDRGLQGASGPLGPTGATGMPGVTGAPFVDTSGERGMPGAAGPAGATGATGATGMDLSAEAARAMNIDGVGPFIGRPGATGATGATGAPGDSIPLQQPGSS